MSRRARRTPYPRYSSWSGSRFSPSLQRANETIHKNECAGGCTAVEAVSALGRFAIKGDTACFASMAGSSRFAIPQAHAEARIS